MTAKTGNRNSNDNGKGNRKDNGKGNSKGNGNRNRKDNRNGNNNKTQKRKPWTQHPSGNRRGSESGSWLKAAEAEIVLEEEGEPEDGCGEEEGVDAVEDAAVAG